VARLFGVLVVLWSFTGGALAEPITAYRTRQLESQIADLFVPGRDFVDVKIAIDRIVDPAIDPNALRREFDDYIAPLMPMLQLARTDHEKFKVLRHFMYEAGHWNRNLPLAYDHSDPLAKITDHKFFSYLLHTRSGTCSTMPVLVMLAGRRIGLHMTLAHAPYHVLLKMTDSTGTDWNLEATSGAGYTRTAYYRERMSMTDKAVANGIYLRTLNDEETVAAMADFLVEWFLANNRPEEAIVAATAIYKHDKLNVYTLLARGSAYTLMLRRDIFSTYKKRGEMSAEVRAYAERLSDANFRDFSAAEALGWTEQDDFKTGTQ
jgi:regulator of sirC expression with transglutaminase-like and TPR domain